MPIRALTIPILLLLCACAPGAPATEEAASALSASRGFSNESWPPTHLGRRVGPVLGHAPQNQPAAAFGTLFSAGNGHHEIWSVADPEAPVLLSVLDSPHSSGEAESHQVSFARFDDGSLHAVTISGRGVDLWDLRDLEDPVLEHALILPGIDYGDFTAAVWGVFWQGRFIYVGGTSTGLHVIDAADPSAPKLVRRLGPSELGGVSAGPLYALGTRLVVTTPKESAGIAVLDISTPEEPRLEAVHRDPIESYIGGFYGRHAYLLSPLRIFDVLSTPGAIELVAEAETPRTEYLSFADGHAFLGSLRRTAGGVTGILEYDVRDPNSPTLLTHFEGRDLRTDDQFSLALGNLLVIADDERSYGTYLMVRSTTPDQEGPTVLAVDPPDGMTEVNLGANVGLSLSDLVELESADLTTVSLRPLDPSGRAREPVRGRFGLSGTVLSFSPLLPLEPETTYELQVPADGLTDLVGNGLEIGWRSTFRTGAEIQSSVPCAFEHPEPVSLGAEVELKAIGPDPQRYDYRFELDEGSTAAGASVHIRPTEVGRRVARLIVSERPETASRRMRSEAEDGVLDGGVRVRTDHPGFSGLGYADFPLLTSGEAKILWPTVWAKVDGRHLLTLHYALGDTASRRAQIRVDGGAPTTVHFPSTGAWTNWGQITIGVELRGGLNAIELVADGEAVPNIDALEVQLRERASCSATLVVHHPIPDGPSASASRGIASTRSGIWVVNRDHGSITSVAPSSLEPRAEVIVGGSPRTLAEAADGSIWVTVGETDEIAIVEAEGNGVRRRISLPPGSGPQGLVFSPDGSRAYVTLEARGSVVMFDGQSGVLLGERSLGRADETAPKLRSLAITGDGSRLFVARFISPDERGEVYELDPQDLNLRGILPLGRSVGPDTPDGGRGLPNYLGSMVVSPDGRDLWIPSKQDNIERGLSRDGEPLTHDNTVRPIVSRIDLRLSAERTSARIDSNDACMPVSVETSPLGDLLFIALQGNHRVEVRDTATGGIVGSIDVGAAPESLQIAGRRLYVSSFLDRTLHVIDVGSLLDGRDSVAPTTKVVPLTAREVLSPEVLLGKRIFYDASDRRMSKEGYVSCAACHLDGGEDGRVWDFTDRGEGLRNTISLLGPARLARGRLHWSGNFDEVQDFEGDIRGAFGGLGFLTDEEWGTAELADPLGTPKAGRSAELDALAAYLASLSAIPRSPHHLAPGRVDPLAERGRGLFESAGCAVCHPPPLYTDLTAHDVGTLGSKSGGRLGGPLYAIETPSLLGVFATPPYLHDGSAPTLEAAIARPGHGGPLTEDERAAIAAHLRRLDGPTSPGSGSPVPRPRDEPEPPGVVAAGGCECVSGSGSTLFGMLLAAILGLRAPRRRDS